MLRRAGAAHTVAFDRDHRARLGRALPALAPSVVVLAGRSVTLDAIGRLVYAVRSVVHGVQVFDFRGAVPDTGASTVRRLGAGAVGGTRSAARPARRRLGPNRSSTPARPLAGAHRAASSARAGAPTTARFLESAAHAHGAPSRRSARVVSRARGARARALARARRIRRVGAPAPRGAPQWGFYEGPPTANGPPGSHHVLARVFKDIFPRYRTMCGYYVERKGGWDCHGLPVELAVEAELGFTSKDDIERFGIAEFNARCREKVLSHVEEWNRLTERIGFWIDLDDAYRTLDPEYIESVWWALRRSTTRGCCTRSSRSSRTAPATRSTLSSHELGQPGVYRDVHRPVGVRAASRSPRRQRRGAAGRRAAGVDDDAVDARLERRGRGRPRADVRPRAGRRRPVVDRRRGTDRTRPRRGRDRSSTASPAGARGGRATSRRSTFIPGSDYGDRGPHGAARRLRHRQRRHRPRPHRDRVRRGRLPARRAVRPERDQPGPASTAPMTSGSGRTPAAGSRTPTPT